MNIQDIIFSPHSDMGREDVDIVNQHNNLIKQDSYSDATTFLDNNNYQKGFRASLFNSIEEKLQTLELFLLNTFVANDDEFYAVNEPTDEQIGDRKFWIKPY